MNNNTILAIVVLMAGTLLTTAVTTTVPAAYAGGDNHDADNGNGNDDFCDELLDEFEELNDVVNLDTATDEQIDAVEELRKFLVFEFDCVDEFEDFEWT